ncbi:MAG: DUF1287 domain-containing protein [Chitinophagales bacterium]|nr:DUF1287 domain-containing protein [Chitinophagales bacterium]
MKFLRYILLVFIFFIAGFFIVKQFVFGNYIHAVARLTKESSLQNLNANQQKIMKNLDYQAHHTKYYDPAYVALDYPNGDIDISTGVCADVVVRALRSIDVDLQQRIHEDMKKDFKAYPNLWNLTKPDKNIDHRRVPNINCYLERQGKLIKDFMNQSTYLPGDIVAWKMETGLHHIGVVVNTNANDGTPLVAHNIGAGTKIQNVLFSWTIIGHYRW